MSAVTETVREYFATIGRRGGLASRRKLTRQQAKQMVGIREAKRAAKKAGKPWPPPNSKMLLRIPKPKKIAGRLNPTIRKRTF